MLKNDICREVKAKKEKHGFFLSIFFVFCAKASTSLAFVEFHTRQQARTNTNKHTHTKTYTFSELNEERRKKFPYQQQKMLAPEF
jgi:hypothetical protein